jgi:hypothetical protein
VRKKTTVEIYDINGHDKVKDIMGKHNRKNKLRFSDQWTITRLFNKAISRFISDKEFREDLMK